MPLIEQPLSDEDLERIRTRITRSRSAVKWGIGLAIAAHLAVAVFSLSTPTDFSQPGKIALAAALVAGFGAPFWLFVVDARRAVTSLLRAEQRGTKLRIQGPLEAKRGRLGIVVNGVILGAWPQLLSSLQPGNAVDAECLGEHAGQVQLRSVLRINGHPNPYFDTIVRAGPPGP